MPYKANCPPEIPVRNTDRITFDAVTPNLERIIAKTNQLGISLSGRSITSSNFQCYIVVLL